MSRLNRSWVHRALLSVWLGCATLDGTRSYAIDGNGAGAGPNGTIEQVIRDVFRGEGLTSDLNRDGAVTAADVTSAMRSFALSTPTPSATPEIATATESPTPTVTPSISATHTERPTVTPPQGWQFTDVTEQAGLDFSPVTGLSGGVAAGDYDRDGHVDLYMVRYDNGPNPLFRNRGDGTFEDVGAAAGVAITGLLGSSPVFADVNGDGWLDLFLEGVVGASARLYYNRGDGTFEDVSNRARIAEAYEMHLPSCEGCDSPGGAAWGDYDRDGDLDLFMTHLETPIPPGGVQNLWRNNGDGTFTDVTMPAGVAGRIFDRGKGLSSYMYAPNFADINNDGWPDLLIASDWGSSRVFLGNGDGTFTDLTNSVISDENGMGAAVGDYDDDGNLDWFVTSIWDPLSGPGGVLSGNRLYRGLGDGTFEDTTEAAGVRIGFWGWGSCFADFENDGDLDIFHTNGAVEEGYNDDPSMLFISNGDGTFVERAVELGIDDRRIGQGIVCFDYDVDGDIDIFIQNRLQPPRLYRNDGGNRGHFLDVILRGRAPNTEAIGARLHLTVRGRTRIRELRAGNNFMSQDPVVAHFGLGDATGADALRIVWPDQTSTVLTDGLAADQRLVVTQPE
jgi:hypothetical protein